MTHLHQISPAGASWLNAEPYLFSKLWNEHTCQDVNFEKYAISDCHFICLFVSVSIMFLWFTYISRQTTQGLISNLVDTFRRPGNLWSWSLEFIIPPLNEVERGVYWNQVVHLSVCPSVRLWTQARYRSPGCISSPIAVKLDRDIPWVKISDEFVHGRRSLLNEWLTS